MSIYSHIFCDDCKEYKRELNKTYIFYGPKVPGADKMKDITLISSDRYRRTGRFAEKEIE